MPRSPLFTMVPLIALTALTACQSEPTAAALDVQQEEKQEAADANAIAAEQPGEPLKVGAHAPDFETEGALAGKTFHVDLANLLKKGPVVLYFFPKAFTEGCTAEAKEFADRNGDFEAAGATVIGMSADDIGTLQKFSTEACRDKFAVAQATPDIIDEYGVALLDRPITGRTSYVIAPDGRIAFEYTDPNYADHVRLTYDAVKQLEAGKTS